MSQKHLLIFIALTFISSISIAKHDWVIDFESLMATQNEQFKKSGLSLNDNSNYDYWQIQNPIYNGLATGRTKSDISREEYSQLLLDVWENKFEYELLKDAKIRIQAMRIYLNFRGRCLDVSQYYEDARTFIEKVSELDGVTVPEIFGLRGAIGEAQDVEFLINSFLTSDDRVVLKNALRTLEKIQNRELVVSTLLRRIDDVKQNEKKQQLTDLANRIQSFTSFGTCS